MKSVPMIRTVPSSVMVSPRQNPGVSCCFRISQAPNATQRGAVFPRSVALDAVVKESDDVHKARSQAVKTPASNGNMINREFSAGFFFMRGTKKGSSKKIEKKRR